MRLGSKIEYSAKKSMTKLCLIVLFACFPTGLCATSDFSPLTDLQPVSKSSIQNIKEIDQIFTPSTITESYPTEDNTITHVHESDLNNDVISLNSSGNNMFAPITLSQPYHDNTNHEDTNYNLSTPNKTHTDPFVPIDSPPPPTLRQVSPATIQEAPVTESVPEKLPDIQQNTTPYSADAVTENGEQPYANITESTSSPRDVDFERLEISSVEFSGINLISANDLENLIVTKPHTRFNAEQLQQDLQTIYDSGYFSENISIQPECMDDGTVRVIFELEENRPVNHIIINGNTTCKIEEIYSIANVLKDKPQNIKNINIVIEQINEFYHERGYALANISSVDDNANGDLIFTVQEGIIDEIAIDGNTKTKDYVIKRNITVKPGEVYNEERIKSDLQRIFAVQVFDDVNKTIEKTDEINGKYKVTINIKEAKSTNNVSIGGGIDSGIGIFGEAGINENNFLGRAEKLSLNGLVGTGVMLGDKDYIKNRVNYQFELNFFEPYLFNADNALAAKAYFRELGSYKIPLAIERRIGFNTQLQHKFAGNEHVKGTLDLGLESITLKEGDEGKIYQLYAGRGIDFSERAKQLQDGFFINIAPGVYYNNTDSKINPREGYIAEIKLMEALCLTETAYSNTRLAGSVTKFFPVATKSSLALNAKAGAKLIGNDMPEIFAYHVGGPYSIRGFKVGGVGHGNGFIIGSAELSTPVFGLDRLKYEFLKNMRLSFFVDAGQVFDKTITSTLYDTPMYAVSVGIGLKVNIPGCGPMSIDYGLPLTKLGDYNSSRGYFTFGSPYFTGGW